MATSNPNISVFSKVLLAVSTLLLVATIFVPMWRIDLDAPQYPEGLNLLIYPNKLGGNVEIINGLNHYIGMKTLHAEDFIEFKILPYIILFFALFSFMVIILRRKKLLYLLLFLFVVFGIVAMIDFWQWEYNYGHNLDPNAAIIVPGMAYQPPLIGFKQLLNFGAYSIPDLGGWFFIAAGALFLLSSIKEKGYIFKGKLVSRSAAMSTLLMAIMSCSGVGPEPININRDDCDNCRMKISNKSFAAEVVTDKGRVYKFDDISCLVDFTKENRQSKGKCYVSDFLSPNQLVKTDSLFYIKGERVGSPMGGNIAAFRSKDSALVYMQKYVAMPLTWNEIIR